MESKKIQIECNCGCVVLKVTKDRSSVEGYDDVLYFVSAYESSFGARQRKLKQYLTRLWSAIVGKDYHLYEVVLREDEFHKFSELEGS